VGELALGGGPLGDASVSDDDAEALLTAAFDSGLRLVDTAPSYGESEARIGAFAAGHPALQVATKVGYGVPGVEDWTPRCIALGVERARARLRRDVIDVVFLHSCPLDVMVGRGNLEALLDAKARGLVGAVGYSGQGEALVWALDSGAFDTVQVSVNVVDHEGLRLLSGRGGRPAVMAKRPLASAAFRPLSDGDGDDRRELRRRWVQAGLDDVVAPEQAAATLLRWALSHTVVDQVLVGTHRREHLASAVAAAAAGPLPATERAAIDAAVAPHRASWPGLI
jgi:aryl-alcohol dehydrogenase-like predicted oxidoreductase